MPEFTYTAITKDGRKENATIQAVSLAAAGHILKEQGLLPTAIEEIHKKDFFSLLKNISTITLAEKIAFVENLSVMLKAGISVPRAMQILVKQTRNIRMKNIISDIYSQVESGKGLGEALEKHPTVFSNIFVSMIKVGEMSGELDKSLQYLTIQLQREAELKSKVKGAMIYPSVIVAALIIVGVLMSIFVLPKLTSVFKDFNTKLPLMTRVVMAIADFMSAHAVAVVGLMVAIVVALIAFYKTPTGKRLFDIFLLHFFIINPIVKKINLARFSRILSSLLKSGIPIVQGLEVVGESISSVPYKEVIMQSSMDVKLGKPLTESLSKHNNLFPILVVQMLEVGEESGAVQEILEQLAIHFEEEVDSTLRNLSSIIEPLLLLFIGGIVGILAVALISPIYNITESIQ